MSSGLSPGRALPAHHLGALAPDSAAGSGCGTACLGSELRRLRLARGLSQREVVRRLGLSAHSNLVDYELGRRIPPGDILSACEALFGLPRGHLARLRGAALVDRAEPAADLARPQPPADEPAPRAPGPPPQSPLPARRPGSLPLIVHRVRTPQPGDAGAAVRATAQPPADVRPMHLPTAVSGFIGRAGYLEQLDALLLGMRSWTPGAVTIGSITGAAGVGKTALTVRWAHRVRDRFPDGQLCVDLQGCSPYPPLRPVDALARFLKALGVPAGRLPTEAEEASALYRSLLADRHMLVVLDNAASAGQVRPLLPAGGGSLLLVTSRFRLDGLVARDGAYPVSLDPLTVDEAVLLLARLIGADRVAAERAAAAELTEACAGLPLAVRIAAVNLLGQPGRSIASFVAELTTGDQLACLCIDDDDETAVRTALDLSYARLPVDAQRFFRRLAGATGPKITPEAAAALTGTSVKYAGRMLDRLARTHLVLRRTPCRYLLPDLLRAYAAKCGHGDMATPDGPRTPLQLVPPSARRQP
jgi:transcriptional regulator with XRE-family HTH domain